MVLRSGRWKVWGMKKLGPPPAKWELVYETTVDGYECESKAFLLGTRDNEWLREYEYLQITYITEDNLEVREST